jgi:hypothetical protein
MKNVDMKIEGNVLVVRVDLTRNFGKSKSGKSTIVASTDGNVSLPGKPEVKIGLNLYT